MEVGDCKFKFGVQRGLTVKAALERMPIGDDQVSCAEVWGESFLNRRGGKCKGPEVGINLMSL